MKPGQYKLGQREARSWKRLVQHQHAKLDLAGAQKLYGVHDFPPVGYEAFDSFLLIVVPGLLANRIAVFYVSTPGRNRYAVPPWVLALLPITSGFKAYKRHRKWWDRAMIFLRDNIQALDAVLTVRSLTNNSNAAILLESLMGERHPCIGDFV